MFCCRYKSLSRVSLTHVLEMQVGTPTEVDNPAEYVVADASVWGAFYILFNHINYLQRYIAQVQ